MARRRAKKKKSIWRTFLEVVSHALDASRVPGEEARAVCYTCKNQIRPSQLLFYAPYELTADYWCECCGTKIRIENGSYQCVFFHGLAPGAID